MGKQFWFVREPDRCWFQTDGKRRGPKAHSRVLASLRWWNSGWIAKLTPQERQWAKEQKP